MGREANRASGSRGKRRRRHRGGSALLAVDGLLKRFRRPAWSKRATLGHAHAARHVLGTLWSAPCGAHTETTRCSSTACCSAGCRSDIKSSHSSRLPCRIRVKLPASHACQKMPSAERQPYIRSQIDREQEGARGRTREQRAQRTTHATHATDSWAPGPSIVRDLGGDIEPTCFVWAPRVQHLSSTFIAGVHRHRLHWRIAVHQRARAPARAV